MEIMKIITLLMALVLILSGCSSSKGSALEYQESSFEALISWSVGDTRARARLTSVVTQENKRDITLSFEEPSSLEGLTLRQNGESLSASLGSLEVPDSYAQALIEITDFFNIRGTLKKSYVKEIDGKKFNCAEYISNGGSLYTVYLCPQNALPYRICGTLGNESIILDILEFKIT